MEVVRAPRGVGVEGVPFPAGDGLDPGREPTEAVLGEALAPPLLAMTPVGGDKELGRANSKRKKSNKQEVSTSEQRKSSTEKLVNEVSLEQPVEMANLVSGLINRDTFYIRLLQPFVN